jgi:hypothetical protein
VVPDKPTAALFGTIQQQQQQQQQQQLRPHQANEPSSALRSSTRGSGTNSSSQSQQQQWQCSGVAARSSGIGIGAVRRPRLNSLEHFARYQSPVWLGSVSLKFQQNANNGKACTLSISVGSFGAWLARNGARLAQSVPG